MSHMLVSRLAFIALVCGLIAPLPAHADFLGATWLTARDCSRVPLTQDCSAGPIVLDGRGNSQGNGNLGSTTNSTPQFTQLYGAAMGSTEYTCPALRTGVNGAECGFTFPQLKAKSNAALNARINSNNVAMQTYQYNGPPGTLILTARFSYTTSPGPLLPSPLPSEGGVYVSAYVLDYDRYYAAVSNPNTIFNVLLANLACGVPGVLAEVDYNSNDSGQRAASSFGMNFRNCSGPFGTFQINTGQKFILGAALQAGSSRGGFSDASHTLSFELDPDTDPVALANFERYLTNDVQDVPASDAAIEFYHAGFDHYFMTSIADEVTKLDSGTVAGWVRTGKSFNVGTPGTQDVCRFFSTSFGLKSSHFYTASASECNTVKNNKDWQFEGPVFTIAIPDASGQCPANTVAVYRLYNQGQGGAPNHRFTTDASVRAQMLTQGWTYEGVGMCARA